MMAEKILVIRVGRTGDIVMITAALQAILKKHPQARIDVLTSPDGRRLLNGFDPRLNVRYVHERKSLWEYFRRQSIIRQINAEDYTQVYCFELNPSFAQFYKKTEAEILQLAQTDKLMNYAQRCLELVRGEVNVGSDHEWIWLPVTEAGKEKTKILLAEYDIDDETIVIGFHPSFSGLRKSRLRSLGHRQEKGWPVEYFGQLAKQLMNYASDMKLKLAIVMDLLPEDRELGESIVKASRGNVTMIIPPLEFERYKATLARMQVLVVPNTGPMHIAGAVGTNLIALFGDLDPTDSGAFVPDAQREFICASAGKGVASIAVEKVFQSCVKFLN